MTESLDVILWGRKIGTLINSRNGWKTSSCFYFDAEYCKDGFEIAPLRAPLSRGARMPVFADEGKLYGGLPSFLADSLPDHWGSSVFREWARTQGISMKQLTPLDRLACIGARGMGALEFRPSFTPEPDSSVLVNVKKLCVLAEKVLTCASELHGCLTPGLEIESIFRVGTSAGGRRPKAVINLNTETGEFYSGQVLAPSPLYRPMIIKFGERSDVPTTRIEYSYSLMAKDAGLEMMPCSMLELESGTHFLTERFDRRAGNKLHMQTLAAMSPESDSYEDLFTVAAKLSIPEREKRQIFMSMVMNVLGGNVDDHNKNFSFIMGQDGVWHYAPTYDYTFAVNPKGWAYENRHSMSINGVTEQITAEDLLNVAETFGIKSPSAMIRDAASVVKNYPEYGARAGVPKEWVLAIRHETTARIEGLSGSPSHRKGMKY